MEQIILNDLNAALKQVNDSIAVDPNDLTDTDTESCCLDGQDETADEEILSDGSSESDMTDETDEADEADEGGDGGDEMETSSGEEDDGDQHMFVDDDNDDDDASITESGMDGEVHEQKAIEEIRQLQSSTGYLIPFANFNRLVREIGQDYMLDLRFTKNAVLALQSAAESHVVGILGMAQRLAIHADRVGVQPKDVSFAVHLDKCGGRDQV